MAEKDATRIGPLTDAALAPASPGGPPAMADEFSRTLRREGDFIVLWAGAFRLANGGGSWVCLRDPAGDPAGGGETAQDAVSTTPATYIERIISPFANEARIRLMQALYPAARSSAELSHRTRLKGGNLQYHLKELIYAHYAEPAEGRYRLTYLGAQFLVTLTSIARAYVKERDDEGLIILGGWPDELEPLPYCVSDGPCDPKLAEALRLKLTQVRGSSRRVGPRQKYLVRGEYTLTGTEVASLRLAGQGRSSGRHAPLAPGTGEFELTAQVHEVIPGKEAVLDILMADSAGADLGVRLRIDLGKQ